MTQGQACRCDQRSMRGGALYWEHRQGSRFQVCGSLGLAGQEPADRKRKGGMVFYAPDCREPYRWEPVDDHWEAAETDSPLEVPDTVEQRLGDEHYGVAIKETGAHTNSGGAARPRSVPMDPLLRVRRP